MLRADIKTEGHVYGTYSHHRMCAQTYLQISLSQLCTFLLCMLLLEISVI